VRLYTEKDGGGELKGTFYVDGLGNFFSTREIDWNTGYYVTYVDEGGIARHMQLKVTDGNCNRCHGEFDYRIAIP
jgi:hypothetical protein